MLKERCVICCSELKEFRCEDTLKGVWKISCPQCREYLIEYFLIQHLREKPLPLRDSRLLSLFLKHHKEKEIMIKRENLQQLILEADRYVGETEEIFV